MKIKIAGYDIRIVEKGKDLGEAKRIFGEFVAVDQEIIIYEGQTTISWLDTLLHEINHAIYWVYNLKDKDDEERTVTVMATAWVQIYRDNPHLLDAIYEKVRANT